MKSKAAIATAILGLVLLATPAFAQGTPTPSPRKGLTNGKLRSCESKQDAVKNRMDSLVKMATNMESVFDSITVRVEKFYADKVVPSGKTVSNYDALVKDISDKKDVVTKDLADAQSKVAAFSCTSDDPKGFLTQFRLDMQKVKGDLKVYRTAVKNLIVAVRGVAPKESPEPSESPKASPKR